MDNPVHKACFNNAGFPEETFSIYDSTACSIPSSVWVLCGYGVLKGSWFARSDSLVGLEHSVEEYELPDREPSQSF